MRRAILLLIGTTLLNACSADNDAPLVTADELQDEAPRKSATADSVEEPTPLEESDPAAEPEEEVDVPGDIDDLMPRAIGNTHSAITPMGIHFETPAKRTITSSEKAYLTDATKSPPSPVTGLHLQKFKVTLYPTGNPTPADVNQHAIGNCNGDAALADMAYSAPVFVKKLVKENADSTYSVSMFDPKGKPITVNVDTNFLADSSNKLAAVSAKDGSADWATVLEKAVMKYNVVYKFVPDINGIGSEHMLPTFTGNGDSFAFDRGELKPEEITRAIRVSLAQGRFITGGFGKVMTFGNLKTVTAHAYSILVPADTSTMISMRNPWGASPTTAGGYDSSADGVLNLPSTTTWANTIDLRIISSGIAAGASHATKPYAPAAKTLAMEEVRLYRFN